MGQLKSHFIIFNSKYPLISEIMCFFFLILDPETEGFGGRFSMKFGVRRENVDFLKIVLPPRREPYFSGFEASKNRWKSRNVNKIVRELMKAYENQ